MFKIIDGHNDLLLNMWLHYPNQPEKFVRGLKGDLDLPRIQQAGMVAGLFAIFIPPAHLLNHPRYAEHRRMLEEPRKVMWQQLDILRQIERCSQGKARICTTVAQIEQCIQQGSFAMVAHIEGADALDEEGQQLHHFYEQGVRSLGPFWNLPNAFGYGVDGCYPQTPDTGLGLTSKGKRLIKLLNKKKMLIDVSHMNLKGFWDTAEYSQQPIVATHSSAWAITAQPRNLLNSQLAAIVQSQGLVGVNFGCPFIRPDGLRTTATPLSMIVDHVVFLLGKVGEDFVAFGSDFDGVPIPRQLAGVGGMPKLIQLLQQRGLSEAAIEKLCYKNWLRVLKSIWGE